MKPNYRQRYFGLIYALPFAVGREEIKNLPANPDWDGEEGRFLVSDLRDRGNRILPSDKIFSFGDDDRVIIETIPDPASIECEPMEADEEEEETVPEGWQSVEGGTEVDREAEFESRMERMERFEMTLE